jgi:histone deacetylase complex regulatory component SIN3
MKDIKRCPCCGNIIKKPLAKEIDISDLEKDDLIIEKPEGMSDKVWNRFVKGYDLTKITGKIQTCNLKNPNPIEEKLVNFFLKNIKGQLDLDKLFKNLDIELTEENINLYFNLDKKLLPNGNILRIYKD